MTVKQLTKAEKREKARHKSRYGLKVSGRSVLLLQEVIGKKAQAILKRGEAGGNLPQ